MLFPDYAYQQGDQALPQPNTSDNASNWQRWIDTTVRGAVAIITTARNPNYTGSGTTPATTAPPAPAKSGNLLLVGALILGIVLLVK